MSCEGTVIGAPLAGLRMLWAPSMRSWASRTASLPRGKVHSHLVAVEVGVECRTCQWVELDCLAFDHLGLEGLDAETVKSRCTVEKHGVAFHHVFEDIPYDGLLAVDDLLGALDSLDDAALDELADHERLVELGSHVFGDAALVHLELGTNDDNRTGRIVDTLTEEVLTEASLLALSESESDLRGRLASVLTADDLRELSRRESTAS